MATGTCRFTSVPRQTAASPLPRQQSRPPSVVRDDVAATGTSTLSCIRHPRSGKLPSDPAAVQKRGWDEFRPGGVARRQSSPCTGKCSARPAGKPGDFFIVEGEFATFPSKPPGPATIIIPGVQDAFFKAWRNLSGPMRFQNQNQNLGRDHTASRWSAPSPGQRTRREDHALSHRPQMSSGRLFLDRVGRHQSPSPLHRRSQNNTHSKSSPAKGDISTLPARGHFYFALTFRGYLIDTDTQAGV